MRLNYRCNTLSERDQARVKTALTFAGGVYGDEKPRTTFHSFLYESSWRQDLTDKIEKTISLMHCLIKCSRRNRKFAVTRVQYIRVHWDTEWYKWAFYLKLSKNVAD